MNRLPNESLIDFTLRFLTSHSGKPSQQARTPESVTPLRGGPQPICRLLDSSEDIAEVYSRPSSQGPGNLRRKEAMVRTATPAPESLMQQLSHDRMCEMLDCPEWLGLKAAGVCRHCLSFVCLVHLRHGECHRNGKHELQRAQ